MAFPGTYNISYYKGDTFEFNVAPKDSSGAAFDLTDYSALFTIADTRGSSPALSFAAWTEKSSDNKFLKCAIRPADGVNLNAGQTYVYDIQITSSITDPYPQVYTILNGSITVTDEVTGAGGA